MSYKTTLVSARAELYRFHAACDACGKKHEPGTLRNPFNERGDIADDTLHSTAMKAGWKERFQGNIRKLVCPECCQEACS